MPWLLLVIHMRERIFCSDHILVGNFSGHEYFSNFPLCLWLGLSLYCAHLARKVNWREKKNSGLVLWTFMVGPNTSLNWMRQLKIFKGLWYTLASYWSIIINKVSLVSWSFWTVKSFCICRNLILKSLLPRRRKKVSSVYSLLSLSLSTHIHLSVWIYVYMFYIFTCFLLHLS